MLEIGFLSCLAHSQRSLHLLLGGLGSLEGGVGVGNKEQGYVVVSWIRVPYTDQHYSNVRYSCQVTIPPTQIQGWVLGILILETCREVILSRENRCIYWGGGGGYTRLAGS